MTPVAAARRRQVRGLARKRSGVLVVSENPDFIERVRETVSELGVRVIACLGPAASPCFLDDTGTCPLAAGVSVVLVDAPPDGAFRYYWHAVGAADYAERLQRAHPGTFVIVSSRGDTSPGPTGEIAVLQPETALLLLRWGLPEPFPKAHGTRAADRGGGW